MTNELLDKIKKFYSKFVFEGFNITNPVIQRIGFDFKVGLVTVDGTEVIHHWLYEGPSESTAVEIYSQLCLCYDMVKLGKRMERKSFEESYSNDETQETS